MEEYIDDMRNSAIEIANQHNSSPGLLSLINAITDMVRAKDRGQEPPNDADELPLAAC